MSLSGDKNIILQVYIVFAYWVIFYGINKLLSIFQHHGFMEISKKSPGVAQLWMNALIIK